MIVSFITYARKIIYLWSAVLSVNNDRCEVEGIAPRFIFTRKREGMTGIIKLAQLNFSKKSKDTSTHTITLRTATKSARLNSLRLVFRYSRGTSQTHQTRQNMFLDTSRPLHDLDWWGKKRRPLPCFSVCSIFIKIFIQEWIGATSIGNSDICNFPKRKWQLWIFQVRTFCLKWTTD